MRLFSDATKIRFLFSDFACLPQAGTLDFDFEFRALLLKNVINLKFQIRNSKSKTTFDL